jgi:PAS domain S-box-containing protein
VRFVLSILHPCGAPLVSGESSARPSAMQDPAGAQRWAAKHLTRPTRLVVARPAVLLCLTAAIVLPGPARAATIDVADILILNSYHPGYPWTDGELAGILETLRRVDAVSRPSVEYLDGKRFSASEHAEWLREYFLHKYKARKFKLLMLMDNAAFEFGLALRDAMFPEAGIVFCGVNGFGPEMLAGHARVTGVAELSDVTTTLDVALRLHPRTREVVVVHDYTVTGLAMRREVEALTPRFAGRTTFRFLDNLPIEDVEKQLAKLPRDRLVLLLSFVADRDGRVFGPEISTERLTKHCLAPVYGVHEVRLGHGIVGGSLLDARLHGMRAAQVALRVLAGEDISRIPVDMTGTSRLVFDYRQLARFRISPAALPAGSVVINEPESLFHRHRDLIIAGAVVVAALGLIILTLVLNILTRRRAEEELRRTSELLHSIINASPLSILTLDPEGRVLSWNPASERMFGWTASEAIGHFLPFIPSEKTDEYAALRSRVLAGEGFSNVEVRRQRRDGIPIDINISTAPLRDHTGKITGIVAVSADVTERRRIEADRARLVRELEAKNQELESLLYAASHDLRSPLLNIQGFAEEVEQACKAVTDVVTVAKDPGSLRTEASAHYEQIDTALQFIRSSTEKMNALINAMLSISRTGRAVLRRERLDMNALLEAVVASLQYQIQEASAEVEIHPLPPCLADADQVNQVFTNLLDNALKYRDASRPLRVTVSGCTDPNRQEDRVVYCVEDTGSGIAPEHQPRIWELFHRLNPRADVVGEGVGLTLVRRIVERHNGRVWLESVPGVGSRFYVALPASE